MTPHHEEIFKNLLLKSSSKYYGQALDSGDFEDLVYFKALSELCSSLCLAFIYEDTAERMLEELNR